MHVRAGSSPAKMHYTPPPPTPPPVAGVHQRQSSFGALSSSGISQAVAGVHGALGVNPLLMRANTIDDSTAVNKTRQATSDFDDEKEIFC